MLIVIEGLDLTGKSTLAAKIAKQVRGVVLHSGKPSGHPLADYETRIAWYRPTRDALILDRWHVGEYVWPAVFGRETQFDIAVSRHVELFMRSRGAVVVYGERDPDVLLPLLVKEDEPVKTAERLHLAMRLFDTALDYGANPEVFEWDIDDPQFDPNYFIKVADRLANEVAPMHALTRDWLGTPRPDVLFVGDAPGAPPKYGPLWMPLLPEPNTCGHYLFAALPDTIWRRSAFVNAHVGYTDHQLSLRGAWATLGHPNIVALGTRASQALEHQGLEHVAIPHPQWWKRFKHSAMQEYTDLIEEAATQ